MVETSQLQKKIQALVFTGVFGMGLFLGGCGKNPLRDARNPYYRRGYKLLQERKYDEAVSAFERSLRLDPDSAMSHLQLGILYEDTFKDPASAIYHYEAFLKKRPESSRAEAVMRWKQRAEKHLLEQLQSEYSGSVEDAQPVPLEMSDMMESESDSVSGAALSEREALLLRRVRELTVSLQEARKQIALLQKSAQGGEAPQEKEATTVPEVASNPPPPVAGDARTPDEKTGKVTDFDDTVARDGDADTSPGRVHVIVRGDTLSSLSRRYYGSLKYWPLLKAENRDVLGKNDTLVVGRTLRIPPLENMSKPEPRDE